MGERLVCKDIELVSLEAVCSAHPIMGRVDHRRTPSLHERQVHGEPFHWKDETFVLVHCH